MRAKLFIILAVMIVMCIAAWTAHAQKNSAGVTVWEYRVIQDPATESFRRSASFDKGVAEINQLGTQGWELVGVNNGEFFVTLYFKRSK